MALKVDVLRNGKYTVCRRVCASFKPGVLQAGAVKGLIIIIYLCAVKHCVCPTVRHGLMQKLRFLLLRTQS